MTAQPPDGAPAEPLVVVVGAGISGLTAAWQLVRHGDVRVLVLEGSPRVGGKLSLLDVAGRTVDGGAESLLARRPEATDLAREVGLGSQLVAPATSSAALWTRGALRPLPVGTLMGVPGSGAAAHGVLTDAEAAQVDAEAGRPATALDADTDVASYVEERVGAAVVDRLVEPLLGGVYAGHARQLSLQATLPALWPAATKGLSLTETVRAQQVPAPEGTSRPPVFAGLDGGVGQLPLAVRAAIERAGGEVRTGVTVRDLRRDAGGWVLTVGSRADETQIRAAGVVLAVPARPAARLLRDAAPQAATDLGGVESASVALVVAVLPGVGDAPAGSGFLVPPVEGRVVKAATFSSTKWDWVGRQGPEDLLVRLSVGRHGEEHDLHRTDGELTSLALAELSSALGRTLPGPLDAAVVRWGGGLPQYAVGHVDRVTRVRAAVAGRPGLAVCGAYLDGVGIPACIAAARAAADDVADDLTKDPAKHLAGPS